MTKSLIRVVLAWAVMCLFCPTYAGPNGNSNGNSNGDSNGNSNGGGNQPPLENDSATSDYLENQINSSATANGGLPGDYSKYASDLAKTFSLVSSADQAWIFGE